MEDILLSISWQPIPGETQEIYTARLASQRQIFKDLVFRHGRCYMVKFGPEDIRPMWEDQINLEELRRQIKSPGNDELDCPLCQPYDHWDSTIGRYTEQRYLTRIIHYIYPEGFIDKTGVWTKCPCLITGEKRKKLKFKGMIIQL